MNDSNALPAPDIYRVRLGAIYWLFLRRMGIDPETGDLPVPLPADRKFACYPYIGSKYGTDSQVKRLLVVGLEVAHDFSNGGIPSFGDRRVQIERTPVERFNPHFAGVYFTALRYACPHFGWEQFANADKTCQAILKEGAGLPASNPVHYVAVTNFYKWITKGATKTAGARDRKTFNRDLETQLFLNEVSCLRPDIIAFQGTIYGGARFRKIRQSIESMGVRYHVLEHPARRRRRWPKDITLPRQIEQL